MNSEVALTYGHWMEAMRLLQAHESASHNEKELAGMVASLIDINRYDPETISYINNKAEHYLKGAAR